MAVIGKIRKRVGLLIAFVGLSMFLFILGDLVTSNKGIMSRDRDVIGVVGSEKVRYPEFEKKVDQMVENYKLNTQKENVDQATQDQLREQAWTQTISELTVGKEYKKLGISCSAEEMYDMCTGRNPHQQIKQAFTNKQTGAFNPQDVVRFLKDLPNRDEKTQVQWHSFEEGIHDERIADKYKSLIKGGIYVTTAEAQRQYLESSRSVSIRAIRLGYETVPDSTVTVEDKDLRAYYNEHQNDYKQAETTRRIEYVTIDINPSDEDKAAALEWIAKKKQEFATATDVRAFAEANSDSPFDSTFKGKGAVSPTLDSLMTASAPTEVIGPYMEAGTYKIARLSATRQVSDSVKARHILVKIQNNDTASAMHKADSLKSAIKKGQKFDELARKYSEDPGSAVKGGDLGWFKPGMMVGPFNDACFNGKKGDMPIVQSQFGVHLIEIMEKAKESPQVQIATVERKVEPSQKTYDFFYNKAQEFAAQNSTGAAFDSAAIKKGLNKRVADNIKEADKTIPGLEQPREVVRWAYKANKGEVSKVFTLGDKYVIAHLTDIKEKGIPSMEDVKDRVTAGAKKAKKGEMLLEKLSKNAGNATSIDAIAHTLAVNPVTADKVSFSNNYIPGLGNEPRVLGAVFTMKQGQLSKPIKGENAVYVISVESITEPPAATDLSPNQKQLADQRKQRSEYEVANALKEKAKVEDNRGKFY